MAIGQMVVDIPTVTGRHRNTALATARRQAAISLVLSGATYQAAADELGYANRGTVYRIVHQALTNREAESIDELRQLEVNRLDALQRAHWDAAMTGDIGASRIVLRTIDQRARLLGLYAAKAGRTTETTADLPIWEFRDGHLGPVASPSIAC